MIFERQTRKSLAALDAAIRDAATRHHFSLVVAPQEDHITYELRTDTPDTPFRISVLDESGTLKVTAMLPTAMMQPFGFEQIMTVASQAEREIIAIISEVTTD